MKVGKGYMLDFPYISMHAIAGAESSLYGGRACLYCQLDGEDLHEVGFIPSDPAACTVDDDPRSPLMAADRARLRSAGHVRGLQPRGDAQS